MLLKMQVLIFWILTADQ